MTWDETRRAKLTPAEQVLYDDKYTSTPSGPYRSDCYICRDPDFAQMGLPLCRKCAKCDGHIPADDTICSDCGNDEMDDYAEAQQAASE
jgi:hypothetical protein